MEITTGIPSSLAPQLHLGAGADFSYGKSDMKIDIDGTVNVTDPTIQVCKLLQDILPQTRR
jgi:hypothetical protein